MTSRQIPNLTCIELQFQKFQLSVSIEPTGIAVFLRHGLTLPSLRLTSRTI